MSVVLRGSGGVVEMPNPSLNNEEALESQVNYRPAMDGTDFSYVKRSIDSRLTLTFENIGRGKIVELEEFYKLSAGERITFTDWRDAIWDVVFEEGPLDTSAEGRSANSGGGRFEQGTFKLILIGRRF